MKKNIIRTMKGLYDLDAKRYVTEAEAAEPEQPKDEPETPAEPEQPKDKAKKPKSK